MRGSARKYDVRMAQFVLKIEKLSHIMGPRASQDLRSPSPIMVPGVVACGIGRGSRDSIRPIKCRFSRGNGGHISRSELRIGCRFSTDFCAHHENQTKIFSELLVQYLGQYSPSLNGR